MTVGELLLLAERRGFSHVGALNIEALEPLDAVREMCAADRCRSYGKNWTCPPACGTLDEVRQRLSTCWSGVLLQSTGTLEDDFDYDTMSVLEREHKARFLALVDELQNAGIALWAMAAGVCTLCESCGCPDLPCRFPQQAFPSMEANGLLVSQVCEASGLPYYYGPRTLTYTSCILLCRTKSATGQAGEG